MSNHNQEPTRECCELCKKEVVHSDWFNDERPCSHNCHSIKPPECEHELSNVVMNHPSGVKVGDKMCLKCNEVFVSPELSWGDELIEKSFLLNVLDGIDIADEQMGNKGGGTKAIRFALQSRIGIDFAKDSLLQYYSKTSYIQPSEFLLNSYLYVPTTVQVRWLGEKSKLFYPAFALEP